MQLHFDSTIIYNTMHYQLVNPYGLINPECFNLIGMLAFNTFGKY